jgi:hypothetical protein
MLSHDNLGLYVLMCERECVHERERESERECKLLLRYLDNKTRENEIKCNEQFCMQFGGLGLNVFLMPSLVYMC